MTGESVTGEADPLLGTTIAGKYTLVEVLGRGGMATVFRATQEAEPREVAVKVLHEELSKNRELQKRFRREAQAATVLDHVATVRTLDFGVDGARLYLVLELVKGHDLFEILRVERRISERRAARIVAAVCEALEAAHAHGIVHRDLKPENIMAYTDGAGAERIKVLDFGIAKMLDEPPGGPPGGADNLSRSVLTRVGVIVGTPEYVSPEQGRSQPVDARSDVYACGVVLYQLVTGTPPFTGDSPLEIVMRHVRQAPEPPRVRAPGLSPDLERVILKALEKEPADRFQTAAALAAELERIAPGLSEERRTGGDSATVIHVPSTRRGTNAPASGFAATIPSLALDGASAEAAAPAPAAKPARPEGLFPAAADDERTQLNPESVRWRPPAAASEAARPAEAHPAARPGVPMTGPLGTVKLAPGQHPVPNLTVKIAAAAAAGSGAAPVAHAPPGHRPDAAPMSGPVSAPAARTGPSLGLPEILLLCGVAVLVVLGVAIAIWKLVAR